MDRQRERARKRGGFTLAEVLVVLGIIAILFALAIPGVITVRKNLKMVELNATAKEIFLAAQNNLTELAAGGGALELSAQPGEELRFLMDGDADMARVLPTGAVATAVAENHYMVVYYPGTLTVKEVYYAERAFSESGQALQDRYGEDAPARRADEVGFYNGENTASNPPKSLPKPVLTIENGEELVARVRVPNLEEELIGAVTLTVRVSSRSNAAQVHTFLPVTVLPDIETEITLDSLVQAPFKSQCPEITPGDDIEVTAEVVYTGGGEQTWLSAQASKTTNSLFASRDADGTARIACGRHLQNLDAATSGADPTFALGFAAVQTAEIDWSKSGVANFSAVENEALLGYDGQNNEIRNLAVRANPEGTAGGVGLFGATSSKNEVTLSNIRMVNSSVKGGNHPTGSLIGRVGARGAAVEGCLVYWDGTGKKETCALSGGGSSASVGGLIGEAQEGPMRLSHCGVGFPSVEGNRCYGLGGLVGYARNSTITGCYAVADQLLGSAEQIGGLVGRGDKVDISNCYAVGNIAADRRADKPESIISGFVSGNGRVENSYCAMTYLDEEGEEWERTINYAFMSSGEHLSCAYLAPTVSVDILNKKGEAEECTYKELKTWRTTSPWTALGAVDSHSYRTLEEGEPRAYPFPGLLAASGEKNHVLPHYGSWPREPEETTARERLAYYEVYADGTWGYDTVDLETGEVATSLKGNEQTIVRTGYGLLLPEGTTPKALGKVTAHKFEDDAFAETPLPDAVTTGRTSLYPPDPEKKEKLMAGINEELSWSRAGATVTIGTRGTFLINPHFGAAMVKDGQGVDLGTEQRPLQVRTVAQFDELGRPSPKVGSYFSQTHDIDFQMTGGISQLNLNYAVTYDGQGNRLLHRVNRVFQSANAASVIKNVVVDSAHLQDQGETGILLNSNNGGTVSGCTVIDSIIEGRNVAGLLWNNSGGTVTNCSFRASKRYEDAQVISPKGQAAGLIGQNLGKISGCYVAGTVSGSEASGFAIRAGNVTKSYSNCLVTGEKGAAGFHYSDSSTAADCYSVSTVRATGNGDAAGFSLSSGWPELTRCYFAGTVETAAGKAYGFAPRSTNGADQYYYTPSVVEMEPDVTWRLDYSTLCALTFPGGESSWTTASAETTHPYAAAPGSTYPFPRLAGLDHWGDWPAGPEPLQIGEGVLGVFYYTAVRLSGGGYQLVIDTSALQCAPDGSVAPVPYDLLPHSAVVYTPFKPATQSGTGVFYAADFPLDTAAGSYFYAGEQSIPLRADARDSDMKLDSKICFIPVTAEEEEDGALRMELEFVEDQSDGSGGESWKYGFRYTESGWTAEKE